MFGEPGASQDDNPRKPPPVPVVRILSIWKASDTETDLRRAVMHQPLAQRFSLDSGDLVGGVVPATGNFEFSEGARGDEISRSY